MNYKQTTDFLFNSFPLFQNIGAGAYKEGLYNITSFCNALGNPQNNYKTIHIAGTNGKGSVAHTLASVLNKTGLKTGLFTSPHLIDFRERIKTDGQMMNETEVMEFVEKYGKEMRQRGLSFFEMTTAMAFDTFSKNKVDVAVIETGMGGRLDATNIITPVLSVITNIGLEHTKFLGDTIEKIAAEKAGIIKKGIPVVIGETNPLSAPVFKQKAKMLGSDIIFADQCWHISEKTDKGRTNFYRLKNNNGMEVGLNYDLKGIYQDKNILTILTAIEVLNNKAIFTITEDDIALGCSETTISTGLQGRWQIISQSPLTICDTAHNAHGIKSVVQQIKQQKYNKLYMVFGMVNDKDFDSIMPLLPDGEYIFTQPSVARALPAEELQAKAAKYGLKGFVIKNVEEAYRMARRKAITDDMIYVGGSSFVVADLLKSIE